MNEKMLIALCKIYKDLETCYKWAEQLEDKIPYIQTDVDMLIENTFGLKGDWNEVYNTLADLSITPKESAKEILEIVKSAREEGYIE